MESLATQSGHELFRLVSRLRFRFANQKEPQKQIKRNPKPEKQPLKRGFCGLFCLGSLRQSAAGIFCVFGVICFGRTTEGLPQRDVRKPCNSPCVQVGLRALYRESSSPLARRSPLQPRDFWKLNSGPNLSGHPPMAPLAMIGMDETP